MKILNANAGALTNWEVLDFLRSKGASSGPSRLISPVHPSEFKVYDYLMKTPTCNQTREKIEEFVDKCKSFHLAKAEVLNIINLGSYKPVELDIIIELAEQRLGDEKVEELIDLVNEVFPNPPSRPHPAESSQNEQETERQHQNDG